MTVFWSTQFLDGTQTQVSFDAESQSAQGIRLFLDSAVRAGRSRPGLWGSTDVCRPRGDHEFVAIPSAETPTRRIFPYPSNG
jgi:hypothetical protein